jgi:hypothetical protein
MAHEEAFPEDPFFAGAGPAAPGAPIMPHPGALTPDVVQNWMEFQSPFVLKQVLHHARWLLEQRGVALDDLSKRPDGAAESAAEPTKEEEDDQEESGDPSEWYAAQPNQLPPAGLPHGPPPAKMMRPSQPGPGFHQAPMQWTPAGWVLKDNSHKVTTTMKPLPEPEVIPPASATYPDAAADKDKLKMLESNVSMMQFELNKICRRFKISALNKDDLTVYPEDQQERLKMAINCVANAEKTLGEFKDFLKNDKYGEWNALQKQHYEDRVRAMIGETPTGVPHKKKETEATEG